MRHFSSPHFQNHHSFVYICQMNLLLKYLFYDWPKINEHVFLKFKCTCTSYIHVDIDMLPDLQGTDNVYFGQDTECKFQHCDIILFVHVCTMHWKSYQYAWMHCNLKSTTYAWSGSFSEIYYNMHSLFRF